MKMTSAYLKSLTPNQLSCEMFGAVYKGHISKARQFLNHGVDPNHGQLLASAPYSTAAFHLIGDKQLALLPDLLAAGLDLSITNQGGQTATAHLVASCNPEAFSDQPPNQWPPFALLDAGAPADDPWIMFNMLSRNFSQENLDGLLGRGVSIVHDPESGVPNYLERAVERRNPIGVLAILEGDPRYSGLDIYEWVEPLINGKVGFEAVLSTLQAQRISGQTDDAQKIKKGPRL